MVKTVIIKNPNPKAKYQYMVLVNAIGDKTFGFLDWKEKRMFRTKLEAKKFVSIRGKK